jgi:hypothetical protein
MSQFDFLPFLPLMCQTKVSKTFLWVGKLSVSGTGLNHQIPEMKILRFFVSRKFAKIHLQIYKDSSVKKIGRKQFLQNFHEMFLKIEEYSQNLAFLPQWKKGKIFNSTQRIPLTVDVQYLCVHCFYTFRKNKPLYGVKTNVSLFSTKVL